MDRIKLTLDFLKENFDKSEYLSAHPEDKKYRLEHTLRVANIGKEIALREGFDVEAMVIACLLHDLSYCETFSSEESWLNHGRRSTELARDFISSLNFSKEVEEDILYGIAIHVDDKADFEGIRSSFALSVGDSDNIDRFDVLRIYETLKRESFDSLPMEEQLKICSRRIEAFEKYLNQRFANDTTTSMLHERFKFQQLFYKKLKSQLEHSEKIG